MPMYVCPECGETFHQAIACPADGAPAQPRGEDVLLGQTIGVYRVARLLGVGGMGRVYKGVHPGIGSRVAIKVLSRECSERQELVDRFFAEARAVNLIRHESIVNVLDLSALPDGRPYIIMEYLDGAALADLIAQPAPLPLGGVARLMTEVLDALQAAHGKGIVHRDLKPDNIFVTPQGRVKVLDFGIAKLMPEMGAAGPTRTGSLLGTPHYMAPEQALAHHIDARTDVYACGVILYEATTRQKPFVAESLFDLLRKHIEAQPVPPRALRPDLPPAYEQVILHAMAKDPAQRFQSAQALAQALVQAAQQLPAEAWAIVSPSAHHGVAGALRSPSGPGTPPQWATPGTAPLPGSGAMTPGAPGAPGWGHGSTVSSGQLVHSQRRGAAPRRSKAPWIIGGLLLGGAAIAGIVIAAQGGKNNGATAADPGGGAAITAGAGGAAIPGRVDLGVPGDGAAGPGAGAAGSGAGAAGPGAGIPGAGIPGGKDVPSFAAGDLPSAEDFAAMGMDPETMKKLAELQKSALAMAQNAMDQAGAQLTTGPGGAVAWRHPGAFDIAGFDAHRVDPTALVAAALARARSRYPDAELIRIDANGVFPDGHIDLTMEDSLYVQLTFASPSGAKRPASVPKGMDWKAQCRYLVHVDAGQGPTGYPMDDWDCDEPTVRAPRCTAQQVWTKAIAKGADHTDVVAELGYWADDGGKGRWILSIRDGGFSEWLPDDC